MQCKVCGGPLPTRTEPKGRKRIYCSTKCRMIAWTRRHGLYVRMPATRKGRLHKHEREREIREYYERMGIKV